MQGRRIADGLWPENPGEYSKHKTDQGVIWFCCAPLDPGKGLIVGSLKNHAITEHDDGTITAAPSIFFNMNYSHLPQWHGYLEHGIWREC